LASSAASDVYKRQVYNRAEYLNQRREMLQSWADFVDAQIEEGRKVVIGKFGKAYETKTVF
ncbi:hypothetical protein ELP57_30135, partial [Klebsiella pneumoniae]|nr:hypothetical protein [Klebsiella pneumoniae]